MTSSHTRFKRELQEQVTVDVRDLISHIEELMRSDPNPQRLSYKIGHSLEMAWLAGAQWALHEGSERVASMLPVVAGSAIEAMGREIRSGEALSVGD